MKILLAILEGMLIVFSLVSVVETIEHLIKYRIHSEYPNEVKLEYKYLIGVYITTAVLYSLKYYIEILNL